MAGPMKQFNKDEALQNALDVFWQKGFEATSMQELVNVMGVNRASLYQTYGNKDALYNAAVDRYIAASLEFIKQSLSDGDSPLGNLQQLFLQFVEQSFNKKSGCFIGNTAAELGPHNSVAAEKVRDFWNQFESFINAALIRAIECNELAKESDTQKLASFINSNLQGLLIKSKANVDISTLRGDLELLFKLIKQ